jgi:uncharacterized membrane-anchored protein
MSQLQDHPLRYQMINELHARPFPVLTVPCRAAYLAIKPVSNAVARDRELDRAHLISLLDRYGAKHPQPGATHYFGDIGKFRLKWESHTEFVTYTIFEDGLVDTPFDPRDFEVFPADWLAVAPGVTTTSALIRVEAEADDAVIEAKVDNWFVSESLAVSQVLDDSAVIAGDFRLDVAGHMRFAIFVTPEAGARRVGRVVQRVCEIETYKTMSMLGLTRVRALGPQIGAIDARLTELMGDMTGNVSQPADTLEALLKVSSELEKILALSSFRFGATGAYEALVNQRTSILREERFHGRQTIAEFMMRRFDPAMRTVKATEARLKTLAERAMRAGDLLRTRVDVERSAQNQALLESMDRRADAQLKLQRTVEGFSVAAISYYAVNLLGYLAYPFAEGLGLSKGMTLAILTPIVLALVFVMVRRMRNRID